MLVWEQKICKRRKRVGWGRKWGRRQGKNNGVDGDGRGWKRGTYDDVDNIRCRTVVWYKGELRLYLDEMK